MALPEVQGVGVKPDKRNVLGVSLEEVQGLERNHAILGYGAVFGVLLADMLPEFVQRRMKPLRRLRHEELRYLRRSVVQPGFQRCHLLYPLPILLQLSSKLFGEFEAQKREGRLLFPKPDESSVRLRRQIGRHG